MGTMLDKILEPCEKSDFSNQFLSWSHLKNELQWERVEDCQRLSDFSETCPHLNSLTFKLDTQVRADPVEVQQQYDCWAYYKHGDGTVEWRPCRIVRTYQKPTLVYVVEFQCWQREGEYMWFHRRAEEILFSAEYTRFYQPNFTKHAVSYLNKLYTK